MEEGLLDLMLCAANTCHQPHPLEKEKAMSVIPGTESLSGYLRTLLSPTAIACLHKVLVPDCSARTHAVMISYNTAWVSEQSFVVITA